MEEQKYFIPKIEDVRVGYECEVNTKCCGWEKHIIRDLYMDRDGGGDIAEILFHLSHKTGGLRVPYLSKEQIEAEGWYFTQQIGNTLFFKKKDFELTFNNNYININNFGENDLGYWGQCKDVNTLRYISKLLEV